MKNDKILIELDKKKLIKVLLIVLCIFLVFMGSFLLTNNKSEKYKDSNSSNTSDSGDNSILETATKEAGEVSDNERKEPNQISIDDYFNLYNGSENKLILFSRTTCQYCKIATPILENIIYKYNVEINYLNVSDLSSDDNKRLIASNDYFSEGYGTPLILVVKGGEIVYKIEGLVTREDYIKFFEEYEFMEE